MNNILANSGLPLLGGPAPSLFSIPPAASAWAASPRDSVDISGEEAEQRALDRFVVFMGRGTEQTSWDSGPDGLLFEANKPEATLAVIDGFGVQMDPGTGAVQPEHGEMTAALAMAASGKGEENLLRIDDSLSFGGDQGPHSLEEVITSNYVRLTETTREALREIREHHPQVNTVVQSEGLNGPSITHHLLQVAQSNPGRGVSLAHELGLPTPVNWGSPGVQRVLAEHVQDTLASSTEVADARQALQDELGRSQGKFRYFNSAGNDGELQRQLESAGFTFDPSWAGNSQTVSPLTQSVAAAEPGIGLNGQIVGAVPSFYSQDTNNSIAFSGVANVTMDRQPVCQSTLAQSIPRRPLCGVYYGTSFAAPRAAGTYNRDPQTYDRLRLHALPPVAGTDTLGTGLL